METKATQLTPAQEWNLENMLWLEADARWKIIERRLPSIDCGVPSKKRKSTKSKKPRSDYEVSRSETNNRWAIEQKKWLAARERWLLARKRWSAAQREQQAESGV
jgi:hypothetical protein